MATAVGRDRLRAFVDVVVGSLDDPATGAQLAARVYLSRFHFQRLVASALGESPDGRPSLVVFSTPGCTACRTAQYPAVEAVARRFGQALRILMVDLSKRPAVGQAFRVLTAPTTVVLSGDGRIASFNHGFAPAEQLEAQVGAARSSLR